MKRCFLIGHRNVPEDIGFALKNAIRKHIREYGVREFVVGMYGTFDRVAAREKP